MKSKLLLFGFLIYSINIFSQGIMQGTITSKQGDTLSFAHLMLYQDSVFITGVSTDSNGYYTIKTKPGFYDLKLSYMGFNDLNIQGIELSETQSLDLDLELKAGVNLPEIIVQAVGTDIYKCVYICSSRCGMQCYIEEQNVPITKNGLDNIEIQLYPNPAVEYVNIKTEQEFSSLHIFNINGQLIRSVTKVQKGQNTLNLSGLIPGTYLFRFQEDDKIISKKLIVKNSL